VVAVANGSSELPNHLPFGCHGDAAKAHLDDGGEAVGADAAFRCKKVEWPDIVTKETVVFFQQFFFVTVKQAEKVFRVVFHFVTHALGVFSEAYKEVLQLA